MKATHFMATYRSMPTDPDYGPATNHANDPRNDDPLDCEVEDDDMSDAERAAEAEADMLGCYPDWR